MELLATVHWIASKEGALESGEVVSRFYAWNERKRMFKEPHIRLAWNLLCQKEWLTKS